MLALKISLYLLAFILANFLVIWFNQLGLIITALIIIPFDFVMRCSFHEDWKGAELIVKLGSLVIVASLITYLINSEYQNIALGSMLGFMSAQIVSGILYQLLIRRSYFIKVNGSDAIGILIDSIIFQLTAFSVIVPEITISQFLLKIIGGMFWYWIIFVKFKLQKKWL